MSDENDQLSEAEIAERMERNIRRFLKTPPKPHGKNPAAPSPKRKKRPATAGRPQKGKTDG
jgi:hypothetical protein